MKIQALLFHLLLLLLPIVHQVSSVGNSKQVITGGWTPIENVNDPHVQELGKFAVSEHNRETKLRQSFKRVVSGETQVVAGINYRLLIQVIDAHLLRTYEAVVWEKAWEGFRNLTSFIFIRG